MKRTFGEDSWNLNLPMALWEPIETWVRGCTRVTPLSFFLLKILFSLTLPTSRFGSD